MKIMKEFVLREIAGEAILIPVGETTQEFNGMLNLTDTAKTIWKNYQKTDSLDEMVQIILEEYEVEEEIARRDVIGFTNELMRRGIISPTKEDRSW